MSRARADGGTAEWTHAGGKVVTCATMTCCHCNRVTIIPVGAKADACGGFCRLCMKPTCTRCADGPCTPFEQKLEAMEARGRMLASIGV